MPDVHVVGPAQSWRVVHDDKTVYHIFDSSGFTSTIYQIFETPTRAAAEAEILKLGLPYNPDKFFPPEEPVPVEEANG